jgi:ubiquinone/menaquinone biosynthesis C-methylase UbiE
MASDNNNQVYPVERAGPLDSRIRRWIQNPKKILGPYVRESMTVLDVGCGPGFFTIDMAMMVGKSGRVIASDLQEGMLEKIGDKINGRELENRIVLHKCEENRIGVSEKVDFALLFYMAHEVPDVGAFFDEIKTILKPNGRVLMVEPPFHVSKAEFANTIQQAEKAGLAVVDKPKLFLSKAVVLENS